MSLPFVAGLAARGAFSSADAAIWVLGDPHSRVYRVAQNMTLAPSRRAALRHSRGCPAAVLLCTGRGSGGRAGQ